MQKQNRRCRTLAALLACLAASVVCPATRGQVPEPSPSEPAASKLVISILDGEGALNDIRQRTAREPIVQVEDENHKPIAGAAVLFLLPDSGPGATFLNGTHAFATVTDSSGRAIAQQMLPNHVSGQFQIRVRANWNGNTAETTIQQKNVSQAPSSGQQEVQSAVAHGLSLKASLIIMGVVGAAAGTAIAIALTHGGSSTTITPGNPIVGAPAAVGFTIPLNRHGH